MQILDTNLWVFGTLGTNDRAERVLDAIERGEVVSALNAYMLQEALDAFDRVSLSSSERDELKTLFCTRMARMTGLVEAPSSRDVSDSLLRERRTNHRAKLLGQVLEVEPKDVPILVLAFKHRERSPAILTNDESFAELEPAEHNLPSLSMEYVP